jgi:hypothetical protein
MSIIESAGSMLWAPRRQPQDVMYLAALAQERFPPEELLDQAQQIATLEAAEPRPGVPRHADGVWTLADPQSAPGAIAAYRRACAQAGREAGEIILQVPISWAEHDEQALESAREWKATLVDEHVTEPIPRPGRNPTQRPRDPQRRSCS